MGNSKLVTYKWLSPNHSGKRTAKIDTITPHCVVGQLTASGIASCFRKGSNASCNYGIGKDGTVALIVDEANRSWCTSSNYNDQRAVTIECASDRKAPYTFNNKVYNKLIELCVDICQRNGKNKLIWCADKTHFESYKPASDEMMLSVHRWYANKSCPGNWMYSHMGQLAKTVTQRLSGSTTPTAKKSTAKKLTAKKSTAKKSAEDIAREIWAGKCSDPRWDKWGNHLTRAKRLKKAGYDPKAVQKLVNKYYR